AVGWVVERGVLTADGALWLRQRRLMQPAFHRDRIAAMGDTMAGFAADLADRWETLARQGSPVDLVREMTGLTMRIVGQALFSLDMGPAVETVERTFDAVNKILIRRFRSGQFYPPVLPTRDDRLFRKNRRELDAVVNGIIAERHKNAGGFNDLLSMLLSARDEETGESMDDNQLRAEVKTLLLAGHETTSNALSWTFYLLSQNPAQAATLYEELDRVLAGRTATVGDLPLLPYTRMVLDESMRLYPPAWLIARRAINADTFGGYTVPAGGAVVISSYLTHRHPEFWDEPERFDPTRFQPGAAERRHRYAYFPFGGGPRQCIGNNFALMEAQLILATLAARFHVRLVEGAKVVPEALVTLRPKGGLPMILERRRPTASTASANASSAPGSPESPSASCRPSSVDTTT
ncbi:MAG: cytochrome P450, partial [Bryobacteraceae bacterium]